MLERIWEYIRGISVLFSDVAISCLILILIPMILGWDFRVALIVWLIWLCIQFLVNDLMMTFAVPVNLYLIFNGIAITVGSLLVFRYSSCSQYEIEMLGFLVTAAAGTGIHSAVVAWRLPGSNGILRYVDTLIVILAFYLYAAYSTGHPGHSDFIVLALFAMVLDLLAVNQLRTGSESGAVIQGSGTGGKLLLFLLAFGCLGITGMVVGVASGQVHSLVDLLLAGLKSLWSVVSVVFLIIEAILKRVILFLVMFLPATPDSARETVMMSFQEDMDEIADYTGVTVPLWVLQLLALAVLLILVGWILYQFRGSRIQRTRRIPQKRKTMRKNHFFTALRELLRCLYERIRMEFYYLRYRKTPQGLLILAERIGKQNRIGRKKSESPGAYIRRLVAVLESREREADRYGNRHCEYDLTVLADHLDRIFYAGEPCVLDLQAYRGYVQQLRSISNISMGKM